MSNKQGNFKNHICVLRVNIHCDGCKKKVKKLLQKIEGVDATMIDADLGKVTVSGYVHPNTLIKKLVKSGKHAELWPAPKNNPYAAQTRPGNQFHDLQFANLSKLQKGGGKGHGYPKEMNLKPKSVKFDLPEDEFDESDGGFSDSEDDGDGFELDFGRRAPSRTPTRGGGGGQHGHKQKKNGQYVAVKNGKSGGGKAKKKRGIFGIRLLFFKGFGRKKKGKNCCAEKKGAGGGGAKGGCMKQGAIEFKSGGKNGGLVVENGKNGGGKGGGAAKNGSKGGGAAKNGGNNFGGGGDNQIEGGKCGRGGGKNVDYQELDFGNNRKGGGGRGGGRGGGGGEFAGRMGPMGNYPVGHMGNNSMAPIGNYPVGPMSNNPFGSMGPHPALSQMGNDPTRQMGNYQAVQGLPAPAPINGGYYPGMGPMNHHHQQYMGMMMNHPHAAPHMYQPTMYARPHPVTGYTPHRASDGYSNMFNDENTESCSIM